MEKFARINLLFDFYGPLLTERQQRILEEYYAQDLSLGEIAAVQGVTRQAVHDTIKRATLALERYEAKLGLVEKFLYQRSRIAEAAEELDGLPVEQGDRYRRIKALLQDVLRVAGG
ncbi:MAG: YlxM family DNA-binding protein [Candidatus Desulforudaceae bacterium]|nr:YlxM family DNA-binding protein [Bacillota bacterium]MBV1726604.1 YlxM family DNA-binding protein [Desulforudis sp.]MDP3050224.1 YlxM family DNA-binding protein [Eubacteriales bacterium]MDQ7789565.1 YlxM family DNA-binding protein [Clostridia bacterium]MBU4533644.1 YlxM family DNA-binding protein [Bacillota bacterium]